MQIQSEPEVSSCTKPLAAMKFSASIRPIKEPSHNGGDDGEKTISPSVLMPRRYQGERAAAACLTASLLACSMPVAG